MMGESFSTMHWVRGTRGFRASAKRGVARFILLPARRFMRCARGVAAVEFGLVAPLMLAMLLGVVEVTRAVSIDRRISNAASLIADLVAREERLSASDITAIYDVVAQALSPFDPAPLSISIIPVKGRGGTTVSYVAPQSVPSYHNGAQPGQCQAVPITDGLIESADGSADSVIVVRATYNFRSLFAGSAVYNANWQHDAYAKPRKRSCIDFEGPNSCVSACP